MIRRIVLVFSISVLTACTTTPPDRTIEKPRFTPVSFSDLPGWEQDDLSGFSDAFKKTCARLEKQKQDAPVRPAGIIADWKPFCLALASPLNTTVRTVIKGHLRPWRVTIPSSEDGLVTGYYESSLRGSRHRHGPYQTPVRGRPLDHVVVDLGKFKEEWKDKRITGQLTGLPGAWHLAPYPMRADIEAGKIPLQKDRVLAFVDDPVDAFFLEIQGSGRINLDDGTTLRIGYDERNGHPYTAIGKILVDRGELTRDTVSMQSIRAWIAAHPDHMRDLLNKNESYIFFRDLKGDGPIGAETVALTPERSIAVDKTHWSFGLPFYLSATAPNGSVESPRFEHLVVAQDTGGAIKGALRADLFWGFGKQAEENAGVMKSRGLFWILLPIGLTP